MVGPVFWPGSSIVYCLSPRTIFMPSPLVCVFGTSCRVFCCICCSSSRFVGLFGSSSLRFRVPCCGVWYCIGIGIGPCVLATSGSFGSMCSIVFCILPRFCFGRVVFWMVVFVGSVPSLTRTMDPVFGRCVGSLFV